MNETIAAIATAINSSGIGIIRMSGNQAIEIAEKIFKSSKKSKLLSEQKSHTIHYGYIVDKNKNNKTEEIDEVLILLMRGPHSFTGEDVVEIDCHGGVFVVKRILEVVIKNGARPANPGEFTKRAFLNGRMDLSQAEAVSDVINSKNNYALKSSISQLRGAVQEKIVSMRKEIIYHTAFIETALDDPEHISVDGYGEKLKVIVDKLLEMLKKLLVSTENGRIIKEGIQTVIVGKPNAGKSSLLNILVGKDKAIVTDIAGTTRDILEEQINLSGISLNIVDTAGIRNTEDVVEKIGVDRAKNYAKEADLIIYVVDSSCDLDQNDEEIIKMLKDKKAIILLNKSDLNVVITKNLMRKKVQNPMIEISTKNEQGLEELEIILKEMFFNGEISFNDEVYITNIRQKKAIQNAYESLTKVNESIETGLPEDFYSIDLLDAYDSLGSITGEMIGEDLVNEIFSKFCMGK